MKPQATTEAAARGPKFLNRPAALIAVAVILACAVVAAVPLILVYVGQTVRIEGAGMSPTLKDGDLLFVSKMLGELRRGDIVVFRNPKDRRMSYIQRVVGLPGETLGLRGGKTFVNGAALEEPYLDPAFNEAAEDFKAARIPDGHYFLMGDNRDNSADSRYIGTVPRSDIYGQVIGRYWPPL